jgi:hypothetical protein
MLESMTDDARALLRHAVATLAYRAAKVLRGFPEGGVESRLSPATRCPRELLAHLADLMHWADGLARGEDRWHPVQEGGWAAHRERFFANLAALDAALAAPPAPPAPAVPAEKILQGPVADALTHVGQLALLRGLAGAPVRPESYARAEIRAGQVGAAQPAPRAEFDGDASLRRRDGPPN